MPAKRTGGGYSKWAVVDSLKGNKSVSGELTMEDAQTTARMFNENNATLRYLPARHIGFGKYRPLNTEAVK